MFLAALTVSSPTLAAAQPTPVHATRRAAAMSALRDRLLLIPSAPSFMADDQPGFKEATDFLYFTGISDLVGAVLAIDGVSKHTILFSPPPNPLLTRRQVPLGEDEARRLRIDGVLSIDSLASFLTRGASTWKGVLVSPTDQRGAIRTPPPMANSVLRWSAWLATLGVTSDVSTAIPVTRPIREIKDATEVAILQRVATLSGHAMLAGMRTLAPKRTQRQVERHIVDACIDGGGVHSFWPWAMSGPAGVYTNLWNAFVDYDSNNRIMESGELVRVDVGCRLEQYMGDVGRTAPVNGRFSAGQREAWDLFIAGYQAGMTTVRNGTRVTDVWEAARAKIRQLEPTLKTAIGKRAATELLSPRGIEAWQFHNVGLDDAEGAPPVLKTGMVMAYEIMFALDNDSFYLEDTILVQPSGVRVLSSGLPYTASEIERAMARK
ncbi:MAG: aminopeptidase P N-terminal domain-containing protein [Gemmatimonadaceae bacterium]